MSSPISPSEIKDTVPSASGSFCEKFLRVLNLPRLFYSWFSYVYEEDGSFTSDFVADLCAVKCECSGVTAPPDPPGGTTTLPQPTSVSATDGTQLAKVIVTWAPVAGADSYEIWRATNVNDFSLAGKVGTSSGLTFDDTNVTQGVVYWFWVRAKQASTMAFSPYSAPDPGYSQLNLVDGFIEYKEPGQYVFQVPAGVTAINLTGIGAGGGGGGAAIYLSPGLVQTINAGGGGGGGAAYKSDIGILTSPGELLVVLVGSGGVAGVSRGSIRTQQPAQGAAGGNGGQTALLRAGVSLSNVSPGGGGQGGYIPTAVIDNIVDGAGGSGGTGTTNGSGGESGQHSGNGFQAIGGAGGVPQGQAGSGPYGIAGRGAGSVNGAVSGSTSGKGGYIRLNW